MKGGNNVSRLLKNLVVFAMTMVTFIVLGMAAKAEEIVIDNNTVQYTVSETTVYWESSKYGGVGKHNTISEENPYTNVGNGILPVRINGYSVLDTDGEITNSYFDENVQKFTIPAITSEYKLMVHIDGVDEGNYRLGWIEFEQVNYGEEKTDYDVSVIPEEKEQEQEWFEKSEQKNVEETANTLQENVETDSEIPRESYILADFSGSMFDFQNDVLEKLENTTGKKYVFSESIAEFVLGKDRWDYNFDGSTDIANALNTLNMSNDSHVYILSDLCDNCGTKIEANEDFCGEITIVYYPTDSWFALDFMKQLRQAYPNATITGF